MSTPRYTYYSSCVGWPEDDIDDLAGMIDAAVGVTRATFCKHVDHMELIEIENKLGYDHYPARGLYMQNDWHVSYHRSKLHGKRVYFFKHSAIEYVFTRKES
jgi:hypothetical protein